MTVRRPLIVNAFALAGANRLSPGLWQDPEERQAREYTTTRYRIGFNLANIVSPGSYTDFIEHVIPELRRRGLWRERPGDGSLRHRIFGRERLPRSHPAARHRNPAARPTGGHA